MKHYLRLLASLIGLAALCLTQLATTAHAGISSAVLRVNLGVTVAPPAAPVTVNGSFTYGVTCIGTVLPQFVLTFPPPAFTIAANAVTPIANSASVSTGSQVIAENTCTFTQLARPVAPAGFLWSGSPPDVVVTGVRLADPAPVYAASFANLLALPTVTAVASPPAGGTVTCTQPTTPLATSTCNATANSGFTFNSFITSSCGSQSSTRPFVTAPLSADCTVTAAFTPDPFVVTAVASPPAGGTISCTTPITFGNSSNCTVTANSGFAFTGVSTSSCGSPSVSSPFSTAALTSNCTVTATFTPTYAVTAVAIPTVGGTASCTSPTISGAMSSCTATANSGYTFTGFTTTSCGAASATSLFVTAPITANCTVTAAFSLNSYNVTAVANPVAGGNVSCTSPVNSGATSSCTATANSGYTFTGFTTTSCGAGSATSPFVSAPITANCTVTAAFSLNTYPITTAANPAAGGTVTCSPNPVSSGSTASCNATANAGYTFTGFTTSSCGAFAASNPYVTNPITSPCTVTAAFSVNAVPVTTTVNIAAGGSISCTPNPVVVGNRATCTVVTNAGYVLTGVSGCSGTVTAPGIFVTAPITAACSVAAAFAPFVIAPSVPVPTLSGWMLILLTLLVVAIGGAICARRLR